MKEFKKSHNILEQRMSELTKEMGKYKAQRDTLLRGIGYVLIHDELSKEDIIRRLTLTYAIGCGEVDSIMEEVELKKGLET